MWTVGRYNWCSLKMAWMHTVWNGLDLAEAKVCVLLNAPLDKTRQPIHICMQSHTDIHAHTTAHIHRVTRLLVCTSSFHPSLHYCVYKVKISAYKYSTWVIIVSVQKHTPSKSSKDQIRLWVKINKQQWLYFQSEWTEQLKKRLYCEIASLSARNNPENKICIIYCY